MSSSYTVSLGTPEAGARVIVWTDSPRKASARYTPTTACASHCESLSEVLQTLPARWKSLLRTEEPRFTAAPNARGNFRERLALALCRSNTLHSCLEHIDSSFQFPVFIASVFQCLQERPVCCLPNWNSCLQPFKFLRFHITRMHITGQYKHVRYFW
jgi:hypothetical protein